MGESYLTPREYQIIAMYIDGVRQAEMPRMSACSRKTIDTHIRVAKERLGAQTIHQLVAMVATADAIKGRGRYSNPEAVTDLLTGAAPSRGL